MSKIILKTKISKSIFSLGFIGIIQLLNCVYAFLNDMYPVINIKILHDTVRLFEKYL